MSAFDDLPPVARASLADQVYQDLRGLLAAGKLLPGEKISLRDVAKVLGVSVMPVRDALNRLVTEQALEVAANRGFWVPHMRPEQFRELTEIRMQIEGWAGELAVADHRPEDLEALAAEVAEYTHLASAEVPDVQACMASNNRLHFIIYRAAQRPQLAAIIESLWLRAGPVILLETRQAPERFRNAGPIERHQTMLRALEAKDAGLMRDTIREDLWKTAQFILSTDSLTLDRGPA